MGNSSTPVAWVALMLSGAALVSAFAKPSEPPPPGGAIAAEAERGARAFYGQHGFRIVARGISADWGVPDLRYEWCSLA